MSELRTWQRQARETIRSLRMRGSDRALIAAAPGTGKTRLTGIVLKEWLDAGVAECVVIVVLSKALKTQWATALSRLGLESIPDIDNGTLEMNCARGMKLFDPSRPVNILTYAQVTSNPALYQALCSRHKTILVCDEIHHAARPAQFGQALVDAFTDAVFKLSLSGTPFNTDGTELAFVKSRLEVNADTGKLENVAVPDYTYSYAEALSVTGEGNDPHVVRPVTFIKWNGQAVWRFVDAQTGKTSERIFDGKKVDDALGPLVDPDLDYLAKMLRAALQTLTEVREQEQANAGMLIATKDAEHCQRIATLLQSFGIHRDDIIIVTYDEPGAQKLIRSFDRGKQKILIAVKMISEGVDIKRLRVGVYASDVLTRMFFVQFVGRFVRWDSSLPWGQFANVFIPEHVTLVKYAQEIEKMVLASQIPLEGPPPPPPTPKQSTSIFDSKEGDGVMNGSIQSGFLFDQSESEHLQAWIRRAEVTISIGVAKKLHDALGVEASFVRLSSSAADSSEFVSEATKESNRNDRLVGKIVAAAKSRSLDWSHPTVNAAANRHVGIPAKNKLTPLETLTRRREFLQRMLISIVRGDGNAVPA